MLEEFRHVMRFRVPFCEVDMQQHVNHAAYIVWAETIRSEYFSELLREEINGRFGFVMAKVMFSYERELLYRDDVAIGCRTTPLGQKSFDLAYEVWNAVREERCAYGVRGGSPA